MSPTKPKKKKKPPPWQGAPRAWGGGPVLRTVRWFKRGAKRGASQERRDETIRHTEREGKLFAKKPWFEALIHGSVEVRVHEYYQALEPRFPNQKEGKAKKRYRVRTTSDLDSVSHVEEENSACCELFDEQGIFIQKCFASSRATTLKR